MCVKRTGYNPLSEYRSLALETSTWKIQSTDIWCIGTILQNLVFVCICSTTLHRPLSVPLFKLWMNSRFGNVQLQLWMMRYTIFRKVLVNYEIKVQCEMILCLYYCIYNRKVHPIDRYDTSQYTIRKHLYTWEIKYIMISFFVCSDTFYWMNNRKVQLSDRYDSPQYTICKYAFM